MYTSTYTYIVNKQKINKTNGIPPKMVHEIFRMLPKPMRTFPKPSGSFSRFFIFLPDKQTCATFYPLY